MSRWVSHLPLVAFVGLATCTGSDGEPTTLETSSRLSAIGPTDLIRGTEMTPGTINASHDVTHGGQFQYTVPLWVVPGRAGMQPELSVSYASGGPTTHLGRGFSLAGESALSRCTKTFTRDGSPGPIRFDDNDAFCLDGQRLVLASGKNGQAGAEYVTEIDDNRKIVIDHNDVLGPLQWTVYHPSGRIDRYGGSSTHRLEGTRIAGRRSANWPRWPTEVANGTGRLRWLRATISDREGNGIRYDYLAPPGVTERVLERITYTTGPAGSPAADRFVEFVYDKRNDPAFSFVGGLRIDQTRLLRQIDMKGPVAAGIGPMYRRYSLTYTRGKTGEPLLSSFSECEHQNVCKRPLSFRWTGNSLEDGAFIDYNTHVTPLAGESKHYGYDAWERVRVADFDGDGADDVMGLNETWSWKLLRGDFGTHGKGAFRDPLFIQSEIALVVTESATGNKKVTLFDEATIRLADTNFDNRADMLRTFTVAIPQPFVVQTLGYDNCVNVTSEFTGLWLNCAFAEYVGTFTLTSNAYLGDFDGNGQLDLLRQLGNVDEVGVNKVAFDIRAGEAWSSTSVVDGGGTEIETYPGLPSYVLDLDGDRSYEVTETEVTADDKGLPVQTGWLRAFSVGRDGVAAERAMNLPTNDEMQSGGNTCMRHIFADINGDGLADSVVPGCVGKPAIFINTGSGFRGMNIATQAADASVPPPRYPAAVSQETAANGILVMDINRDGRQDLVYTYPTTSEMFALIATPDGNLRSITLTAREPGSTTTYPIPVGDHGPNGPTVNQALDINGDGADDFIQFVNGELHVYIADPQPADLLASVEQVGAQDLVSITYAPGGDRDAVERWPNQATFPQVEGTARGVWVVRKVARSNGAGGSTLEQSHTYVRPLGDVNQGFLGFKKHVVHDPVSTTTYAFDLTRGTGKVLYPTRGLPIQVTTDATYNTSGGTLRTLSNYTYSVADGRIPGATVRVRTDQANTTHFQSAGPQWTQLERTVDTLSDFDPYGNPQRTSHVLIDPTGTQEIDQAITYTNYTTGGAWMLGRTKSVRATSTDVAGRSAERSTSRTYDPATGALESETIQPGDPAIQLETRYTRDSYGNVVTVDKRDASGDTRRSIIGYDPSSVYPTSFTNPLSHTETVVVHPGLGVVTSATDRNHVTTSQQVDGFGRVKKVAYPGGEIIRTRYGDGGSLAASGIAETIEQSRESSTGKVTTFYDGFGRPAFEDATDFSNRIARTSYNYNPTTGWVDSQIGPQTVPQVAGQAVPKLVYTRDRIGRPLSIDSSGAITQHSYNGLTRTIIDPSGHKASTTASAGGVIAVRRFDSADKPVITSFTYGPFGLPATVTHTARNAATQTSTYSYDAIGRVTAIVDEANTKRTVEYTPFGEPRSVSDFDRSGALVLETRATFDDLGRILTFADLTNHTFDNTYLYDSAPNGIGKLTRATTTDGVVSRISYDALGRLDTETTTYNGESYTFTRSYDSFGRPGSLWYPQPPNVPSSMRVTQGYDPITGVANTLVSDVVPGFVWNLTDVDFMGRPTKTTLGNGLVDRRSYDAASRLTNARTETASGTRVREHSYNYYANGNMRDRNDLGTGRSEHFMHDFLDRLVTVGTSQVIDGGGLSFQDGTAYDDFGNITSRSRDTELMTYSYNGGAKPHGRNAVTGVTSPQREMQYEYDARGNQTRASGSVSVGGIISPAPSRTIEYTAFDLPRTIHTTDTNGTHAEIRYIYDAFNRRIATNNTTTGELVIECGPGFRRTRNNGGDVWEATIQGPFGSAALVSASAGVVTVSYLHDSALGSLDTVTDANGAVVSRRAYTPFGEVRDVTAPLSSASPLAFGFTGHRHDTQDLVNMNGRLYDSLTARFVSKDPASPRPLDSQSYNRYSYVHNVPLVFTDPSGFQAADWSDGHAAGGLGGSSGDWIGGGPFEGSMQAATSPSAIAPHAAQHDFGPASAHVDDQVNGFVPSNASYQMFPDEDPVAQFLKKAKHNAEVSQREMDDTFAYFQRQSQELNAELAEIPHDIFIFRGAEAEVEMPLGRVHVGNTAEVMHLIGHSNHEGIYSEVVVADGMSASLEYAGEKAYVGTFNAVAITERTSTEGLLPEMPKLGYLGEVGFGVAYVGFYRYHNPHGYDPRGVYAGFRLGPFFLGAGWSLETFLYEYRAIERVEMRGLHIANDLWGNEMTRKWENDYEKVRIK